MCSFLGDVTTTNNNALQIVERHMSGNLAVRCTSITFQITVAYPVLITCRWRSYCYRLARYWRAQAFSLEYFECVARWFYHTLA